jgi:hypothetical protein
VFCANQANGRALVLRSVKSGERRTLYTYERDASVLWSPDSRRIVINDYAGTDYTNNLVVSIYRDAPPIDRRSGFFNQIQNRMSSKAITFTCRRERVEIRERNRAYRLGP